MDKASDQMMVISIIATGDGGSGGDPQHLCQRNKYFAWVKFLCIDVDGGTPYAIPPPIFYRQYKCKRQKEISCLGIRNPLALQFRSVTGWLFARVMLDKVTGKK